MKEQTRAVLFDCWSTLFTNDGAIPIDVLADKMGVEDWKTNYEFIKAYERNFMLEPLDGYETPIKALAKEMSVRLTDEEVATTSDRLHEIDDTIVSYDDTFSVLDELHQRDISIGLISNTDTLSMVALRQRYDIDEYVDAVIPSYEAGSLKPDEKIFDYALDQLGTSIEHTIMVGDNRTDDAEAAVAYGLKAGILLDRDNAHPDYSPRITTLTELLDYI